MYGLGSLTQGSGPSRRRVAHLKLRGKPCGTLLFPTTRSTARVATLRALTAWPDQAGFFQQTLAHHIVLDELVDGVLGRRQFVRNPVLVLLGDADFVIREEHFFVNAVAVHLDAIGAAQITDDPVALIEGQLAMLTGHIGVRQPNITRFSAAHRHDVTDQRDRVATAHGNQFTVGRLTHYWTPSCGETFVFRREMLP